MTEDKARKIEIRARMDNTGESYTEAARHVDRSRERAASLGREEMAKLLTVGAEVSGFLSNRAAAHLITFTALMGAPAFAPHVEVAEVQNIEKETVTAAFVKDWASLVADDRLYFVAGDGRRLLRLAASFHGVPITLTDEATGLAHAHARRLVEAMMISTRITEQGLYHLVEGPGMDRVRNPLKHLTKRGPREP